jgi:hypothetical protein
VKTSDLLLLGALGVGLYFLLTKGTAALASAVGTATQPLSSGIANFWVSLTQSPSMSTPGNALLPNGTKVPISSLPIGTDAYGNVFTNVGGGVYQLSPSDANGDYPATLVGQ